MKGDRVKNVLRDHKIKITELALLLGESQSNMSSLLSVADIKTGLIERISSATGIPVSEFFGEKSATLSASMTGGGSNNRMIAGNGNSMGDSAVELEALRRENELLKKWMAEKDGQIEFLRELLKK